MASQPLEEMMAQQQRAGGEDLDTPPGAPCESLRDRAKPWGFPQLSALGSLAEFWLLWNEGSPQAPPEIRKPVKVGPASCNTPHRTTWNTERYTGQVDR